MARIVGHLSVEELEARYRAARDVTAARHAQAIWLLAQGRTVLEVAAVLAFAPRWVTRLAQRYNASGPEALGDRRRRNGKAAGLLTPDLLAARPDRARQGTARGRRSVERPQGRPLDGAASRPGEGAPAARLGGAEADRLVHPSAAAAACARGHARAAGDAEKNLDAAVPPAKAAHPDRPVEVWAEDENRLGLKPVRRRVWAPVGQRPIALGHHRHQWLHVIAFVQPTSGETVWHLASGLSKPFFGAARCLRAR